MYHVSDNDNHMKFNRLSTVSVVIPVILLIGCGSDPSTATKPRTEAECAGLAERARGWLESAPTAREEDLEERLRNVCKDAFAYDRDAKLEIKAVKCYVDLNGDTMTNKDKKAMVGIIKSWKQGIKDNKRYANQLSTCPELGD